MAKYIYGIIPGCRADSKGSKQGEPTDEQPFDTFVTTAGVKAYTIPCQDVSTVVSDSEIADYNYLLKDETARHLLRHQQTIEKAMESVPVIPMQMGTFASDEDEVKSILAEAYPIVKEIFDKIADKIEIDVAATWDDFHSVLKEVGQQEEIKAFREKLSANPKGIMVEDQMKAGVMVEKALDEKNAKTAEHIQDALQVFIHSVKNHELMDDKMVMNTAFLIYSHEKERFYQKIDDLNTEFHDELNFRCVGPLPPYSFYTLKVQKMQFEEIDSARKKLGLVNDVVSKDEIKKAYQAKAFHVHPDRNPDQVGIEKKFDEVKKASQALLDYCRGEQCCFTKEAFMNNRMIVKVRE